MTNKELHRGEGPSTINKNNFAVAVSASLGQDPTQCKHCLGTKNRWCPFWGQYQTPAWQGVCTFEDPYCNSLWFVPLPLIATSVGESILYAVRAFEIYAVPCGYLFWNGCGYPCGASRTEWASPWLKDLPKVHSLYKVIQLSVWPKMTLWKFGIIL